MPDEPDVAKEGEDEDIGSLLIDPKQPADEVMTTFQIALAYKEMSKMALEECNRPDMALAFKLAMYRTLEDFYLDIMEEQSAVVKKRMAELVQDETRGIEEKHKRVTKMWQTMEESARMIPCRICDKMVLPEKMEAHLEDKHPKRDPFNIDERAILKKDPALDSEEWEEVWQLPAPVGLLKRRRVKSE